MNAKTIVIDGIDGVGKTTQIRILAHYLRDKGFSVLETKEPGSSHSPLSVHLRSLMLDPQYDTEMTTYARELISQACRSIHVENVIAPNLDKFDFILQDRGILSGIAYGIASGNSQKTILDLTYQTVKISTPPQLSHLYDKVVVLRGSPKISLNRAVAAKQEFVGGDVIENRGTDFMAKVQGNLEYYVSSPYLPSKEKCSIIEVDGKNVDAVFNELLLSLAKVINNV